MSPKTGERRARSLDARGGPLPIEDGRVIEDRVALPSITNGEGVDPGSFEGHLVPIPLTPMTSQLLLLRPL